jgi:hypothetical protein
MNSEDDTFFEDDEEYDEDDTFPDVEEEEEEEYEEDVELDFDEEDYLTPTRGERLEKFIKDPWPRTIFFLLLVGFAVVFLIPPGFWAIWRYFIIADYLLVILGAVGLVYSLMTWSKSAGDRLRWAGITNVFVVLAGVIIGLLDTLSWIFLGGSIVPGFETPLLAFCFVLVIFSLYSLWMIQKSFDPASRR